MPTLLFGSGAGGLEFKNTSPTHSGFGGVFYSDAGVAPPEYQCITNALTETSNTSTQVVYGSESDIAGFVGVSDAEFEAGEFWFEYFVTAGADGAIVSIDSISFEITYESDISGDQRDSVDPVLTASGLTGAAIGNGVFVVVGANSRILYSTDYGANWIVAASPVDSDFRDVLFDGHNFYAAGNGGVVITSSNGSSWTLIRQDGASDYLDLSIARFGSVSIISADSRLVSKTRTSSIFNYVGTSA